MGRKHKESKLWSRDPHTEGKHLVLRKYLDAWFPIMGSTQPRILFIDGFAGPGEYEGGAPGSPLIALHALSEHHARQVIRAEVVFLFVEEDSERCQHLQRLVEDRQLALPSNAKVRVIPGQFDRSMRDVLDQLEAQKRRLAPAFVMLDPFGVSGTPMEIIARILENPHCEIYISFMYENIHRFIETPEFSKHLTDLFGTNEWRRAINHSRVARREFLYALFEERLRRAGARHVVVFHLYRGSRLVYSIFFATQHAMGCDRMKQAIWSVAPFGDFAFRGSTAGQLNLRMSMVDFTPLERALCDNFRDASWVPIEAMTDFVASDATEFHTGHLKKCLKQMESRGVLSVRSGTRRRKFTYPPASEICLEC